MNNHIADVSIGSFTPPTLDNGGAQQSQSTVSTKTIEKTTEELFRRLVAQWRDEPAHLSLVIKKVMHPAYQRIIGLGPAAIPLLLQELQRSPGHWTWALRAITGEDPTNPEDSITQAAQAWVQWGQKQHLI